MGGSHPTGRRREGERDKQRDVPLASDVIELIDAHALHFAQADLVVADRGTSNSTARADGLGAG